jgi:hypothetical protein
MLRAVCVVSLLLCASGALAAPPASRSAGPPPSSQHNPPVILDEAGVHVRLIGRGSDGYNFAGYIELSGVTSRTDLARIDWKQKGKLIASAKCQLNIEVDNKYAYGSCDNRDVNATVTGDVEGELIYWDDQEEKEYLVRTFKARIHSGKGLAWTWQFSPDDLLASAWMYLGNEQADNSTYRRPTLYFWTSGGGYLKPSFRCTVNGTTRIEDFEGSPQSGSDAAELEADYLPEKGDRVTYRWKKQKLLLDIYWGKRDTLKWEMPTATPQGRVLGDNPGKWECKVRHEGKAVRMLYFTVDADGMVQQDEMQSGEGAIPTVSPRVALVDIRLTPDSASFDERIVPAALKASMGFGLPWPKHAKVKEIHASYPPKSGQPDPK